MKTKNKNTQVNPEVQQNDPVETGQRPERKGVAISVNINDVTDPVDYTFTGMTCNSTLYYELPIFTKRYGRSESSIRRDIDGLEPAERFKYCVSASKKHYVNEGILLSGKKKFLGWRLISNVVEGNVIKTRRGICGEICAAVAQSLQEDAVCPVTGLTTNIGITYSELTHFAEKYHVKPSALRSQIKEISTRNRWSRERFRYVITVDGKHFVSPAILFFNKSSSRGGKYKDYATFFRQWEWSACGTLRFNQSISEKKAVWIMEHMFNRLKDLYPGVPAYFAFVTEKDPDGFGFHNHFVYGNADGTRADKLLPQIKKIVEPHGGRYDYQTHVTDMDNTMSYLNYITKEMNLRQDGYGFAYC